MSSPEWLIIAARILGGSQAMSDRDSIDGITEESRKNAFEHFRETLPDDQAEAAIGGYRLCDPTSFL
ncbi:hypothetical protein [Notoacmeibacter ruber]|uniref:Uncharacterized protein n=1 Tax=Notoacmeibacter ruber TaxID=2670375 RepID=A0A3L7J8M3_9HYPH|nr:hypothetical protein [Notoacmeibacter ruber]RLQ87087.1 hypothetical protein D8780_01520 [Notoacmeibacter ruber]